MKQLGDIAFVTKLAGFEYTKYIHYASKGEIIMIRGVNCKSGRLVLDDVYYIDKATSDLLPRSQLQSGDLVLSYVGTVGDVAIIDKDDTYHLAPNVAKIRFYDTKLNVPEFWNYMFMLMKNYIIEFAKITTQASLSMNKIREIPFIVPKYELQADFVLILKSIDKLRFASEQKKKELLEQKKALFDKYFR